MIFPDGTSNHFEYSCCGLDWTRDRLNRVTTYTRDALGRTISATDPENRLVEFRYNAADQITNLITWVGGLPRIKRFDFTPSKGFRSRPFWRLQPLPKRDTSEKKFRALG
ncbi:MAG: hypothetical protein RMK20_01340 [Verrucomicrobiales bacterium]|nr:hypothetical protein [Verrucomicrobiales bacterium]